MEILNQLCTALLLEGSAEAELGSGHTQQNEGNRCLIHPPPDPLRHSQPPTRTQQKPPVLCKLHSKHRPEHAVWYQRAVGAATWIVHLLLSPEHLPSPHTYLCSTYLQCPNSQEDMKITHASHEAVKPHESLWFFFIYRFKIIINFHKNSYLFRQNSPCFNITFWVIFTWKSPHQWKETKTSLHKLHLGLALLWYGWIRPAGAGRWAGSKHLWPVTSYMPWVEKAPRDRF